MKSDKVIVAFLKSDNEEHLLYKKEDNLYYDLNTKEKHQADDIDFDTLIYLKDSIYFLGDNISKRSAKKIYGKDRKELLDTTDLYIINLQQVFNLERIPKGNDLMLLRWKPVSLYKVILKRNCQGSYSDLRTGKLYLEPNEYFLNIGTIYVDEKHPENIIPLNRQIKYYGNMEKKKV